MSFKHTAPVKAKNLSDLVTLVQTILTSEHFEASKTIIAQVKAQADELQKDIDAEVELQLQREAEKGENSEVPSVNDGIVPTTAPESTPPVTPEAPTEPVEPVV